MLKRIMRVGVKIFFASCVGAAALLLLASQKAVQLPGQDQDNTSLDTAPSLQTVRNVPYTAIWTWLTVNFKDWKKILTPENGVTVVSNPKKIMDKQGHLKPDAVLYPFQKVSSVYVHNSSCHWNEDCNQMGFCAYPTWVFKTVDGYYVAILSDTGQQYPGPIGSVPPWLSEYGAAMYDPDMNYLFKITNSNPSYNLTFEIHPPLSTEYKTADMGNQCKV